MGILKFIKNKAQIVIDNHDIKKAFKDDKRSVNVIILKGNMTDKQSIYDEENHVFYLIEDKTTNVGDLLVTEREKKYKVTDVKKTQIMLQIKNDDIQVDAVALFVEDFKNDPLSFVNNIHISQNPNSVITINIETMNESQISNFGNIVNQIDFAQDLKNNWKKLKHDLNTCYHYKDYQKYIELMDESIKQEKVLIKLDVAEKAARIAGAFLGEIIRGFTSAVLDKYGN